MRIFLRAAVMAAVVSAPVCAVAKPNPLSADLRQTLFVKDVEVVWSAAKDDTKNGEKPEYVAYKEDFQRRVQATVSQAFLNSPAGQEAAELKIEVKEFSCASTGCFAQADVSVLQLSDGKSLGVYTKVRGMQVASGGLLGVIVQSAMKPDVVGITANNFAAVLKAKFDAKK